MNTEVTTEMMNEVIAVFDRWERYEDRYGIWFKRDGLIKCLHPKLQDLQYHTSWSALMPVGKKIRDLLADMQKKRPPHTACHGDLIEVDIHCAVSDYDIVNAHKNMYIFITWYNEYQQKQNDEQQ